LYTKILAVGLCWSNR